jgi:hypothetical protein
MNFMNQLSKIQQKDAKSAFVGLFPRQERRTTTIIEKYWDI